MIKEALLGVLIAGDMVLGGWDLALQVQVSIEKQEISRLSSQLQKDESYQRYIGQVALEDNAILKPLRASQTLRQCIVDGLSNPKTQWDDVLGNCQKP